MPVFGFLSERLRGWALSKCLLEFELDRGGKFGYMSISRWYCLVVLSLLVPLVTATGIAAQPAPEPTRQDIAVRDQLIADQENLLNTYRCLFAVDVDAVPGGCPNPDTIVAGPAPANPAQSDLDVRDELIQSQETLLNVYRCQHDIDTQLVPGGCATRPAPQPTSHPTGQFTAITAGDFHSCGIRADNTAVCWGANEYGQADAPAGQFTAITASGFHSCGIRADHTAVCWGRNSDRVADAPAGQFTAITASGAHSCGIKADHTAICWGYNEYGQADAPAGQFTAITAGGAHSCGIKPDHTAVCWGYNEYGQADAPAGPFAAITAGDRHSCGIRADHTAVCWGRNLEGGAVAPAGQFTAITAGYLHSCGIRADHTAVCWGANYDGQADAPAG